LQIMHLYRYEAVDKTGKVVRGVMKADSEQQVSNNLSRMGYTLRSIYPSVLGGSARNTRSAAASHLSQRSKVGSAAMPMPVNVRPIVPLSQLAGFFRQLAVLVKSGVPVSQALHDVSTAVRNRHIRNVLPKFQELLQAGEKLSVVMVAHQGIFPVHAIASVWAGEMSGKLDGALEEVAVEIEREATEVRKGRIGWGIAKSHIIGFLFLIWAANLNDLLTQAAEASLKGSLTSAEVLAIVVKGFLMMCLTHGVPLTLAVAIVWIAWGRVKRVPSIRRVLDGLLLIVPVWGKLHRYRSLARFLHVLDEVYESGISPGSAWGAASLTARNSVIAERLRGARSRVPADAGISQMMEASGVFVLDDIDFVVAGERAGQVPQVLSNLAASYADRAELQRSLGRIWSVSLLIALVIAVIGIVLIQMVRTYFEVAFKFVDLVGG
jgi:type IV pilus assembly protein PilC